MSRNRDFDSDSERLPEGFTRAGYDADTQQYHYRDSSGQFYVGPPGSRYGRLQPTGRTGPPTPAWDSRRAIEEDTKASWAYFLPFLLLCFVFLAFILWPRSSPADAKTCNEGSEKYVVKTGDTCWEIAKKFGTSVAEIIKENGFTESECRDLGVGQALCIPASQRS